MLRGDKVRTVFSSLEQLKADRPEVQLFYPGDQLVAIVISTESRFMFEIVPKNKRTLRAVIYDNTLIVRGKEQGELRQLCSWNGDGMRYDRYSSLEEILSSISKAVPVYDDEEILIVL
jgi:hypothetical protein